MLLPLGAPFAVRSADPEGALETDLMVSFRERRGAVEFQALYDRASPGLLTWITRQARSRRLPHDPADLLQDTFVNIFRYAHGFRDDQAASFRVWSRQIATNVVRRASLRSGTAASLQALPSGFREPQDRHAGPSECAASIEEMRSLARAWMVLLAHYAEAFATLRDRERRALDMIEIQGLSYAQAAAELGVGSSNMKMIVFRARKRIRAQIALRLESSPVEAL